ncbi:ABC transporter ATP-binding protein [Nakamurella antarctica]|uniref:ABC transporter ATP-binding protein n=1 Tax=Nakamurella antarctica TaxID=1902245 RepID=A0A3G8ZIQ1_9ACTN|nr:ABC transporter ATP-binding protein [Nakamurella antarctica]AZI57272.1 ABC transporter ATP-binding protein [Nakamurella antarctica]
MSDVSHTPATEPLNAPVAARSSTLANLRRLLPYVRPALPSLIASAITALIATLCGLFIPLVIGKIIDGPIAAKDFSALWGPGLLMVALGVLEAALFGIRRVLSSRPTMRVEAKMRQDIYCRLQSLPMSFHDKWSSGQLLSRAVSDLSRIRWFLAFGFIFLFVNLVTLVVGVLILLSLAWQLGLIFVGAALPLVVLCIFFENNYRLLARRSQDQVGDLATIVEESVLGIRILKSFGRSAHLGRVFLTQAAQLRSTELAKVRVIAVWWSVITLLPEIAIALALFFGVQLIADGTMSAGTLTAFFAVAVMLRWPVDSIGWLLAMLNDAAATSQRYFEVMDAEITVQSPGTPVPLPPKHSGAPSGEVRFEDVRFRFADAKPESPDLLRGVTLHLHAGQTVAVVGATGSGKTVLTSLVNRLYDVTGGRITLDGVDVRELSLPDLRSAVSVAFEEPTLFSASVRENVTLGRPDSTEDDVLQALSVAQADFVHDLPWGLDTRIGEQGMSLSGGQRQRLALARAVVGDPRVLVLDDPLSALDIHTEAAVEAALRNVLARTTCLMVAHRASTVMMADQVALLVDGAITAIGPHSHLLATVPAYRKLLTTTMPDEVDEWSLATAASGSIELAEEQR